MLTVKVLDNNELWNPKTRTFEKVKGQTFQLEHSLISISKWEQKTHKVFLNTQLTKSELIFYIKCMTITPNVRDEVYSILSNENIKNIIEYMNDEGTATDLSAYDKPNNKSKGPQDAMSNEVMYFYMINYNIPIAICEKWHIKRLLTLIRICQIKNEPPKKMSKAELYSQQRSIKAANEAKIKAMKAKRR